jgi:isopenicillin N synthase-like dioxygenase
MSELGVPVVDISGFFTGNDATRSRVAREVAAAVEGIGFLTIVGHGVPENLMKDVSAAYRSFFDLPLEIKRKYVNRARNTNRGYVPFGDEFVASSHGAEAPPDWRETFAFGRFDVPENPYYTHANAGYAYEDNILPSEAAGMVATTKSFYRALEDLNLRMLKIFAAALDIEEAFFFDKFDKHASVLRAINYPDQDRPPEPGQLRCGAHSDFGTHTFLLIDDAPGGLQVLNRADEWVDIDPAPGSFVINIGDLMMTWTNDRWLSNLHRVANPPPDADGSARRQSIAFFVQPNYNALIECIETCLTPSEPAKHAPVIAWQHRHAKLNKTTIDENR